MNDTPLADHFLAEFRRLYGDAIEKRQRDEIKQLRTDLAQATSLLKDARPPLNAKYDGTQWEWFRSRDVLLRKMDTGDNHE